MGNSGDSTRCWDAGILARYVETPVFLMQDRYDSVQIGGEFLCVGCTDNETAIGKTPKGYMAYFGNHTEVTLRDLASNFGHSVFMPNCFKHTENMCVRGDSWGDLAIGDHTSTTALKKKKSAEPGSSRQEAAGEDVLAEV